MRPGNTGADPVDSLDIMALTAWAAGDTESDLTDLPAPAGEHTYTDEEEEPADDYRTTVDRRRVGESARRRRDIDIDDNDLLTDDPDDDDDDAYVRRSEKKKKKVKEPRRRDELTDDMDDEEEGADIPDTGSRFGGMRRFISKLGRGIIGTPGPDDIDE